MDKRLIRGTIDIKLSAPNPAPVPSSFSTESKCAASQDDKIKEKMILSTLVLDLQSQM